MRRSWMIPALTFAVGITIGLAVGYSKPQDSPEVPNELFVGETVSLSQPVGLPGSNQFAEQRFRIVRIHSMRHDRTPEDRKFEAEFTGSRMTFWTEPRGLIAFVEPE